MTDNLNVIIFRYMRRMGLVASVGEIRTGYRILVGKPKGERPLGRSVWMGVLYYDGL
jgi:hypothetical protein